MSTYMVLHINRCSNSYDCISWIKWQPIIYLKDGKIDL